MDSRVPGIRSGLEFAGFEAQHLEHAAGAMHVAAGDIPFRDDAVDGVRRQTKHLLALGEPALCRLALRDVPGVDHHPPDQRIIESSGKARLQPTVRTILVPDPKLPRIGLDLPVHQLLILGAQHIVIVGVHVVEQVVGLPLLAGIAQRIPDSAADALHRAVRRRDRDDVARMLGERQQARVAAVVRMLASPALRDVDRQHHRADDARRASQRLHVHFEPARGPRQRCDFHRIVMEFNAPQGPRENIRVQRRGRRQTQGRNALQAARHGRTRANRAPIGVSDPQIHIEDQQIEGRRVDGRHDARLRHDRSERQHHQTLHRRHGQSLDLRHDGDLTLGTAPLEHTARRRAGVRQQCQHGLQRRRRRSRQPTMAAKIRSSRTDSPPPDSGEHRH